MLHTHEVGGGGGREERVAVGGSATNQDNGMGNAGGMGEGGVDMRKARTTTISRLDDRDYLTCRLAHSRAKTAALRNFLFAYLR